MTDHIGYFKTSLKLTEKGTGELSDMAYLAKRDGVSAALLKHRVGLVFNISGSRLTHFMNYQMGNGWEQRFGG